DRHVWQSKGRLIPPQWLDVPCKKPGGAVMVDVEVEQMLGDAWGEGADEIGDRGGEEMPAGEDGAISHRQDQTGFGMIELVFDASSHGGARGGKKLFERGIVVQMLRDTTSRDQAGEAGVAAI